MDSMRHLSTSLPYSHRAPQTQELLADFKAAALSVTNLYKSAASAQVKARAAGYQDALDDLLSFLDKENLGLMDGEGWRVRRWATERLDDGIPRNTNSDDEDETNRDENPATRSSSPEIQRKTTVPPQSVHETNVESSLERRVASEPLQQGEQSSITRSTPQQASLPAQDTANLDTPVAVPDVPSGDFTFRSTSSYPTVGSADVNPMEVDGSIDSVRLLPRTRPRNNAHTRHRCETRPAFNLNLTSNTNGKRKMPYPDFFDISGLNFDVTDKKDHAGRGGKRGRFT